MSQLSDWRKSTNELLDAPDIEENLVVKGVSRRTARLVSRSAGVVARRSHIQAPIDPENTKRN